MNCYISLGSNLGDSLEHLQSALEAMCLDKKLNALQTSSLYQSKALILPDTPPQNDYINAVAQLETNLSADQLLLKLHEIEALHGRERNEKWGARTLDLDILLFGEMQIQTETLVIPHLQIKHRNFVIHPLFEIAGNIDIPGLGNLGPLAQEMSWAGLQKVETHLKIR